jgi:hypothetical protein
MVDITHPAGEIAFTCQLDQESKGKIKTLD